ncbi:unnamed protein product [Parnassius apollo]|uniref:(apollo) hypothetical protein n=1 Tax=Parnassius apollo TaxID=110799 RepID=A0A8S3X549_PARAO|nr:unnamed protein product [Parnassius apollo]
MFKSKFSTKESASGMISMQETCNAGGIFSRWAECERILEADYDELELEDLELEDELESVDDIDADLCLKFQC